MKIETKQKLAKRWFINLQNVICNNVEKLEKEYGSNTKFKKNKWKHGEFRTIKGEVIEKGGVAFSNVKGKFTKTFATRILKYLQCILILDLFVHEKIGLAVE